MSADETRGPKYSEVVKKELWPDKRWCRATGTVLIDSDSKIGTAVYLSGSTYTTVTSGNESSTDGIIIDSSVYNYDASDTPTLGLLVKGPAIVASDALTIGSGTKATAITALEVLDISCEDAVE